MPTDPAPPRSTLATAGLLDDVDDPLAHREIALVDLLDRLLAGGVVLTGDLTLAIADVDLVHISLRALITSISPDRPSPWGNHRTEVP
ncbi:gas vesicle protein [Goodfellowiella coeruleoviolacea]